MIASGHLGGGGVVWVDGWAGRTFVGFPSGDSARAGRASWGEAYRLAVGVRDMGQNGADCSLKKQDKAIARRAIDAFGFSTDPKNRLLVRTARKSPCQISAV